MTTSQLFIILSAIYVAPTMSNEHSLLLGAAALVASIVTTAVEVAP
jgi:hypothetical protein